MRFGTANDDAPIKLDFPGKVLRSIKAYCYKDSCDDGFSKLLSKVRDDEAVGVLNERLTNDDIAARGRFLVMLTVAADYFANTRLAPDALQRGVHLHEVSCTKVNTSHLW